jgi:hypothetical protein
VKIAAENAIEHVKAFIDGAKEELKKGIKAELKKEEVKKNPANKKA